jgi:hypothetical protein
MANEMNPILTNFVTKVKPSLGLYISLKLFEVEPITINAGIGYTFFSLSISNGLYLIYQVTSNVDVINFYKTYFQEGYYLTFEFVGSTIRISYFNPLNPFLNVCKEIEWNVYYPQNTIINNYYKISPRSTSQFSPILYPYINPQRSLKNSQYTILQFNNYNTFSGNLFTILASLVNQITTRVNQEIYHNFQVWCRSNVTLNITPLKIRLGQNSITIYGS